MNGINTEDFEGLLIAAYKKTEEYIIDYKQYKKYVKSYQQLTNKKIK